MATEEIRTEEVMATELTDAEDVKESLSAGDIGVLTGIAVGGYALLRTGEYVGKTYVAPAVKKGFNWVKEKFTKNAPATEASTEQEVLDKTEVETSEEPKTKEPKEKKSKK